MSAIFGVYDLDGRPVDQCDLQRMVDALAHQGPDGSGIWMEEAVGLGHRMLWTTPESLEEKLPLVGCNRRLAITADARIDNREELIATLRLTERRPGEITDSRIILSAYETWGEACPEHLIGDYAFVIWDAQRERLFAARDHLGVKPFYYCHVPGRVFAFATEIKALLCLPELQLTLNETRVADLLIPTFQDKTATCYEEILRLAPAHSLTVKPAAAQLRRYWALDASRELRLRGREDYVEAFGNLFREAVRCRLRSAFPVGSTLSGGLDSSSVTCMARDLLAESSGQRLHTFSAIFPSVAPEDPRIDERQYMEAVLATGGFDPHFVYADCFGPLAEALAHEDEFVPAYTAYLERAILRGAHEQGVRVLLTGLDGDTTLSYGHEYLQELADKGKWDRFAEVVGEISRLFRPKPKYYIRRYGSGRLQRLARGGRWLTLARETREISARMGVSRRHLVVQEVIKPLSPSFLRPRRLLQHRKTRTPWPDWWTNHRAINPAFARTCGLLQRYRRSEGLDHVFSPREAHLSSMESGLWPWALELTDHYAAPFGVEQRHPFFDRRLMEFCLSVPFEYRMFRGYARGLLRQAMEGILPPDIQWRTGKQNLGLNFKKRLLEESERVEDVLFHHSGIIERYIDVAAVRESYHRLAAAPQAADHNDGHGLFLAVALACWLRQTRVEG
jgi:asparagine synthase (glutamine-hydrolysing)